MPKHRVLITILAIAAQKYLPYISHIAATRIHVDSEFSSAAKLYISTVSSSPNVGDLDCGFTSKMNVHCVGKPNAGEHLALETHRTSDTQQFL